VNLSLLSLHILFVREHDRRCDWLAAQYPTWSDEQLYQSARRYLIALIQVMRGATRTGADSSVRVGNDVAIAFSCRVRSSSSRKSRTTSSCLP
jgi:hypothetical protein